MNLILWILQVLLALAFAAHGWLMLFPPAEIAEVMNASIPRWLSLFIGVAEVAAAVGLTLPGLVRILPSLVYWAAAGLMIVMVLATILHAVRAEYGSAVTTALLLVMLSFVAYMRWRVMPILPRTVA
jgi:uncharacterized membrane protein YphA (DoxX/SURF4 family)